MDIKQLHYFISVAEDLNFTKAAKRHYIAQTAISQQIMALEKKIGTKLFERDKRSVKLTPAGKVFYNQAKLIIAKSEEAIQETLRAASGLQGTLKVGFMGSSAKGFLPKLVRNFSTAYPEIDLTLSQKNSKKLLEALENRLLDIIFNVTHGIENNPQLTARIIKKYPLYAVLHRDHPLAIEEEIPRSALAQEPFIAIDREEAPDIFDSMIQGCAHAGFTPKIVGKQPLVEMILLMVEAGLGIALCPEYFKTYSTENLHFVKLAGENEHIDLAVVWRKDNPNQAIPLFLEVLEGDLQVAVTN